MLEANSGQQMWPEGISIFTPAGNVGNLPLVIVATVCDERTSIFSQRLGAQCGQIGIAYVAFSMWVAGFVQYSLAYNLLKLPEKYATVLQFCSERRACPLHPLKLGQHTAPTAQSCH